MGVEYDRILDGFTGPFVKLKGLQQPEPGSITGAAHPTGYLISHNINNSFVLVNRLLKAKADVYWLQSDLTADGQDLGTGTIWVPASAAVRPVLEKGARELGIMVHAVATAPSGEAFKIRPVRIGLYDQYGGLMPSGWTRWLFEQFEFPYEIVYPATLDAGNLRSKFDVLVFTDGAMRGGRGGRGGGGRGGAIDPGDRSGAVSRLDRTHHGREDTSGDQEICRVRRIGGDHRQFHQHGGIARRSGVESSGGCQRPPTAAR